MLAKKIDGLAISLASETTDYKHFDAVISRGVPVVFFDRVPLDKRSSCVRIDNRTAAYNAVMHLIKQGCSSGCDFFRRRLFGNGGYACFEKKWRESS